MPLTPRLLLRPFRDADLDAYAAIWAKPEVVRFLPSEGDTSRARDHAAAFIDAWHERVWAAGGYAPWAVEDRATHALLGHAGLRPAKGGGGAELVYMLDTPAWGRGLASEAARAACAFAHEDLGLDYVMAVALAANTGSIAVMTKAGLVHEADTEWEGHPLVRYGRRW